MIAKSPELTQKAGLLAAKRMLTLRPQIQKMVDDFAATAGKQSGSSINSN